MNAPAADRDVLTFEGEVLQVSRGDIHIVRVVAGALRREILCRRSGRLNLNRIKVVAGDKVRIECSPYDLGKGRIVYRL